MPLRVIKQNLLERISRITQAGGWRYDPQKKQHIFTDEVYRIFDLNPEDKPSVEDVFHFFDPNKRAELTTAYQQSIKIGSSFEFKSGIITAAKRKVWVKITAIKDKDGLIYGAIQDITEIHRAEMVQSILLHISQATGNAESLEDLLKIIHEQLGVIFDATNFFVALYNKESASYSFPYLVDQYDKKEDFTPELMKRSMTEYVRKLNMPLLIDAETDTALIEKGEVDLVGSIAQSWMGVPFTTSMGNSGVVVLQSYEKGSIYTQKDLELVAFVCEHIALAIERKQNEENLKESEDRYRTLVDSSPLPIAIHCEQKLVFINKAAVKMMGGKSEDDFLGKNALSFVHPDYYEIIFERYKRMASGEEVGMHEEKFIRLDGKTIDVEVISNYVTYKGKEAIQVVLNDITERKKTERAIRLSEESYRGLFNNAADAIYILDENGIFLDINDRAVQMYGYTREELIGKTPEFVSAPGLNNMEEVNKFVLNAFKGETSTFEFWGLRKNENIFPKEVHLGSGIYFGQPVVIAFGRDISDRRMAEQELRDSEARFRALIENSPVGITITRHGKMLFVNKTFTQIFGFSTFSELLGLDIRDIISENDREIFNRNIMYEQDDTIVRNYEANGLRKDRSTFPFHAYISLLQLSDGLASLVFISDISEQKEAEEKRLNLERQIQQTQKLESLGILAGGIAHDFNNILMAIMGNAELALLDASENNRTYSSIVEIQKSAKRAADLARQMLAYSGKGKFVNEQIKLSDLVLEIAQMLEVSISKKIRLQFKLEPELPLIEGDKAQIQQVVLNLITNASEAIGTEAGTITLRVRATEYKPESLISRYMHEKLPGGQYIRLDVTDTGTGMNNETKNRLFDPFFTTKFTGRGLGLSAVLGIVRGHNGTIKVKSAPGKGSVFSVFFPASQKKSENLPDTTVINIEPGWHGKGTILIVDDEEAIRLVTRVLLEKIGFRVILAKDGLEAISTFRKKNRDIDLVLLDLTMPQMDGEQTFHELQKIRADVPVLLASGYHEYEINQRFSGKGLAGFIQKPYELDILSQRIRNAIEAN